MKELVEKILRQLSKNTLIAIVIGLSTYIINDRINESNKERKMVDEERLYNEVKILNKLFYLQLEVDSLKRYSHGN